MSREELLAENGPCERTPGCTNYKGHRGRCSIPKQTATQKKPTSKPVKQGISSLSRDELLVERGPCKKTPGCTNYAQQQQQQLRVDSSSSSSSCCCYLFAM